MTALVSPAEFNRSFRRMLLLPLLLIALCPVVVLIFGRKMIQATARDRHSVQVLATTFEVEKVLVDLETGLRGFQIAGEENFLEPYNRGNRQLNALFETWEELVADNPAQTQRVKVVRRDHEVWSGYAAEAIRRTREKKGPDLDFIGSGKVLMDRTRVDMGGFIAAEEDTTARQSALVGPAAQWTVAGTLFAFVIAGVGTAIWLRRQMRVLVRSYAESLDQVAQQREWFRVTLSSIGDAVIVTDRDGKINYLNGEAERLTGWNVAEAVGKPLMTVFRIVNEESREPVDDPVERVFRENRVVGLANHTALLSRTGVEWLIEDSAAPIHNRDNKIVGVVLIFQDATERRRAQKELRRVHDEALAASHAKDNFLAALSHELRTPLNPILLQASEGAANPALSAEVRANFEMIAKNVMLEARLIDDLLDLTRITRGKMSFDMQRVDVRQILRDALAQVRAEIEAKSIKLETQLGEDPAPVRADAARLQQVFWNVLRNAVKFTPAGGAVRVEVRPAPKGDKLIFTISDSGIGMKPAELDRAFDYFAQGDHATSGGSHRFGGLGLGLAISRMLVESHSGDIKAESEGPGRGTVITIALPLVGGSSPPNASETFPAEAPPPATANRSVLVVEDHAPTRETLGHLLRKRDYQVVSAGSVAEAMAAVEKQKVDLVISDIGLPDGDGYELLKSIRQRFVVTGIALSGYGTDADVARSQAAGFVAHLTKPISVQTLQAALDTAARASEANGAGPK